MFVVKLCVCVIFLFSLYLTKPQVLSIYIDCVPLQNCSFVSNILGKGRLAKEVVDFLNSSKCGVDESSNTIKVWCSRFVNCRTPDFRNGTCIEASKCAELNDLLQVPNIEQNTRNFLREYRCHIPKETEVHVCCPWPKTSTAIPSVHQQWNRVGVSQRKRHASYYPTWPMPNYRNLFNGPERPASWSSGFSNHFHNNHNGDFEFGWMHNRHNHFDGDDNRLGGHSRNTDDDHSERDQQHLNWWSHNDDSKRDDSDDSSSISSSTETCFTPDNNEGICREIRECSAMLNVLKKVNVTNNKEVNYLKKFQCARRRGSIKVCCSGKLIVLPSNSSVPIVPKVDSHEEEEENGEVDRSLVPDSASCGRQIVDNKIVGGTTTDLAEFPWTALLQYTSAKGRQYGCGGSVISKRFIVTAAHCVNTVILRQAGLQQLDRVILGEFDTRNETDCIYTRYGSDCADVPQRFNVERILEHESFSPGNTTDDIALVRVDRDIVFTNYIVPICLPAKGSFSLVGNESLIIAGWGRTETGETSPVKRKARLPFIDKANCSQLGSLGPGQMCLGSGRGIDSCKGDSGGPVMQTVPVSGDLVTTLVGVISYGFGRCGTTTSVSTYVPFYLDWILTHLT